MNEMKLDATEGKHFYVTEGKRLPSVTTVLGLLANPGLEAWKRNTPDWEEVSSHAANIGTRVHKAIGLHLQGCHQTFDEYIVMQCFNAFLQWKNQNVIEEIETEVRVKSEKGYAGTADLKCDLNGESYIIDFKTSGRIYPDYLLQVSAYRAAYVEMTNRDIHGMGILRLDKQTGLYEFKEYSYEEYQKGLKMFLLLVEYYWLKTE